MVAIQQVWSCDLGPMSSLAAKQYENRVKDFWRRGESGSVCGKGRTAQAHLFGCYLGPPTIRPHGPPVRDRI
jgi:hypothetical protein